MTLDDEAELAALAAPDFGTGRGGYDFLSRQFASVRGMGVGIINSASLALPIEPGKPNLLLYAPDSTAKDVIDPYRPDWPYRLVGWGYTPPEPYDWEQHPTGLNARCITQADWFVHERGIHPTETWQNVPVPPEEERHGTAVGDEPKTPQECDPEPCSAGFQHPRI